MVQPKQTDQQFKLRLPAALKQDIETAAQSNNRSMNAEIVSRLEREIAGAASPAAASEATNRLSVLRKAKGFTQQQLGDAVGSHWITISRLERGEMQLTLDWLRKLAMPLGVRPEEIITMQGDGVGNADGVGPVFIGGRRYVPADGEAAK